MLQNIWLIVGPYRSRKLFQIKLQKSMKLMMTHDLILQFLNKNVSRDVKMCDNITTLKKCVITLKRLKIM